MASSSQIPLAQHSPLLNLPQEIKDHIISFLDPIGYVSLAQTARTFRETIPLGHWHMVQRLLQLELEPAHGVYVPRLEGPSQYPAPTYALRNPWWGDARYACAGCMRIKHHRWFRNKMIMTIPLRKPGPTSRAANALLEPDGLRERWALRRRVSAAQGDTRLMLWGRHQTVQKYVKNTLGGPHDVPGWPKPRMQPYPDSNLRGSVWMDEICGLDRHERRCLECQAGPNEFSYQQHFCDMNEDWYISTNGVLKPGLLVAPRRVFEDTVLIPLPRRDYHATLSALTERDRRVLQITRQTTQTDCLYGGIDTTCLRRSLLCGFCERLHLISQKFVPDGKALDPVASSIQGAQRYDGSWECGCLSAMRSGAHHRPMTPFAIHGPYHRNPRLQWHKVIRHDSSDYILMCPEDFYKKDLPPDADPRLHHGGQFREEALKLPIMRGWSWTT